MSSADKRKALTAVVAGTTATVHKDPTTATTLAKDLAEVGVTVAKGKIDSTTDDAFVGATPEEAASAYLADIQTNVRDMNDEEFRSHIQSLKKGGQNFDAHYEAASLSVGNMLSSRTTAVTDTALRFIAPAAGDEAETVLEKGVWISGLYGQSKQSTKNLPNYNGKISGFAIGADTGFGNNEANLIGLAYSNVHSNFAMKGSYKGDKVNVNSNIFSIYGQYEVASNWLIQSSVSIIESKVTNKSLKMVAKNVKKMATGKFESTGYAANAMVQYTLNVDNNINITPMAGLKYGRTVDGAYNETGTGIYNLSVASKSHSSMKAVAGGKISMLYMTDSTEFVPSIHASIEQTLSQKDKAAKVKLQWAQGSFEDSSPNAKTPKTGYNVGASILAKRNNLELLAGYNLHLKTRYISHQGSLNLKVKF